MREIVFEKPEQQVNFKTDKVYEHIFIGHNLTNKDIKIDTAKANCGCLTWDNPGLIKGKSRFEVKIYLNKLNQSGLYVNSLTLNFNNGETVVLKLSGNLIRG